MLGESDTWQAFENKVEPYLPWDGIPDELKWNEEQFNKNCGIFELFLHELTLQS